MATAAELTGEEIGGSRVTIGSGKFERGYDGCDHAPDWPGAYGIGTEGTGGAHHFPDWT